MAFAQQVQAPGRMALRPVDPGVALPPLKSVRLLDQLRERIRLLHYSLRTEEAYVYWARAYIRFHRLRHPAEMGKKARCSAGTKVQVDLQAWMP